MPGLMSRASTVVKAKFSKLLDRAENPTETLDYSYEQQLQLLQNVKRGVADVVTAKKRLELQQTKLEQSVVKLDTQARQAVGAGREDLARAALERKSAAQAQLQGLEAQVKIGEAATGIGQSMENTGLAIQRARDKTEQMQARAGAIDELVDSGALEDFTSDQTQLDRELAQIASQSQVDSELEKMKAELGSGEKKE